jgi:uncharacterized protein YeaO (DUF488 family)
MFKLKRVYDEPAAGDGYRVLVDRLWPRGMTKEQAGLDAWLRDIAPSPALRTWFGHRPDRFAEFDVRYREELSQNAKVADLRALLAQHGTVTLLYAAKDPQVNHAVVLRNFLIEADR